jgi:hypothetical protein
VSVILNGQFELIDSKRFIGLEKGGLAMENIKPILFSIFHFSSPCRRA